MQFAEGLSDRQAADAVRARIDWKYALGLELTDVGFDGSVFSEFRTRLVAGGAEQVLFETMVTCLQEKGLLKKRGQMRTDSTHILAAVRVLNRLECVGETLRQALNMGLFAYYRVVITDKSAALTFNKRIRFPEGRRRRRTR
jgi:transposase